ncbi:FUSC family protein [Marivirga arenosa]|uniref:FUSC family membrane protein n=1 Tax=Marivirga arenosa TaxID=3059076 RepID=A0AA51ZXQ1_9BACT|nr:FUSC family membrane protein [Marivirga sp. BKB1-2]WNB18679.1 FUSC family membrane protein [Marivirga sp. BKB1-2]
MIKNYYQQILNFLKSPDFLKSIIVTFGIVLPLIIGIQIDQISYLLSISIGVFLTSGSDVPGSRKHKSIGILIATLIALLTTIAITYVAPNPYLLVPTMSLLIFGISFISVYGFRASLISFSGLLAIVLSFAHPQVGQEILIQGLFIAIGGFWYLFLSAIFHPLLQKRQINKELSSCLQFTAQYIRIRGNLAIGEGKAEELKKELFELQTTINATHETLRELLLTERQSSGFSNYKRKQLLIFIELIDILELSMANPANYEKINSLFLEKPQYVRPFIDLVFQLSDRLDQMAIAMLENKKLSHKIDFNILIQLCEKTIQTYKNDIGLPEAREGALLLRNLLEYEENQIQKIDSIERVFYDLENQKNIGIRSKEGKQFITQQDYDLNILSENFSFKSPILKHSARLTIAMLLAYTIGTLFSLQNTYWILLTIVVIMRPGYTLTKKRSKHRLYGTLIGASIASLIVLINQNTYLFAFLAIVSLTLALSFIQKNYKTASVFITTSIVFIYTLINPDAFEVIQYRVVDTIIGAAIAFGAGTLLWPTWESESIQNTILKVLRANRKYLAQIDRYYHENSGLTDYKLARKEAFLEMGNLNAAFQRLSQEPKSQQHHVGKINEIVSINQTLLAAMASLGTYLINHKENEVSKDFEFIIKTIDLNLKQAIQRLLKKDQTGSISEDELELAHQHLEERFESLVSIRNQELAFEKTKPIDPQLRKRLQSTRLISDQMKWLVTISGNIKKVIESLESDLVK